MPLEKFQCCKTCGGTLIPAPDNQWKCRYCGSLYSDKSAEKQENELKSLLDSYKMEMVSNLRKNLFNAVNSQYVSSSEIQSICRSIKEYFPDDFQANFYAVACADDYKALAKYIRTIDVDANFEYIEHIIKFLIRSIQEEFIADLNILIDRAYKTRDLRKYEYYSTMLSNEAEKVQEGIYTTNMSRGAFIAYSSKDMDKVLELADELERNGITCFIAARNLKHGKGAVENYNAALAEAMDNCTSFVFVSTKNSRNIGCDALKIEIPYIKEKDRSNAPPEYRNNYRSIPQKYKKPRVEYRLDINGSQTAADSITSEFFDGFEWAYSPREVAQRVMEQIMYVPAEDVAPAPSKAALKYCVECGAENPTNVKFCSECGKNEFANSVTELIQLKNKKEAAKRAEIENAQREQMQREMMAKQSAQQPQYSQPQYAQQSRPQFAAPTSGTGSLLCPACQAPVSATSKSCSFCGTMLSNVSSAPYTPPTAPRTASPAKSSSGGHRVALIDCGAQKLGVINAIRNATGLGLKDAKDVVENCPVMIPGSFSPLDATRLKDELKRLGATVEIR